MDVLAAAGPAAAPTPLPVVSPPPPAPAARVAAPGATTPSAPIPAPKSPAPATGSPNGDGALKPVVAKLFNASEQNIEVSFQVVKDLNEVITVFTDKSTGKEIVQFPSAALIALAEFFSKLADNVPSPGNVLDTRR